MISPVPIFKRKGAQRRSTVIKYLRYKNEQKKKKKTEEIVFITSSLLTCVSRKHKAINTNVFRVPKHLPGCDISLNSKHKGLGLPQAFNQAHVPFEKLSLWAKNVISNLPKKHLSHKKLSVLCEPKKNTQHLNMELGRHQ